MASQLPADQRVERPCTAAAHEEMQYHDRPKWQIRDPHIFQGKAEWLFERGGGAAVIWLTRPSPDAMP